MSIRGGCFRNGSIAVTLSASPCVDEGVAYFTFNCSGSTCISGRVECPASGDVSVTLGSRSGSHEVNVYAGNRCDNISDSATRTVSTPLGGKDIWVGTLAYLVTISGLICQGYLLDQCDTHNKHYTL